MSLIIDIVMVCFCWIDSILLCILLKDFCWSEIIMWSLETFELTWSQHSACLSSRILAVFRHSLKSESIFAFSSASPGFGTFVCGCHAVCLVLGGVTTGMFLVGLLDGVTCCIVGPSVGVCAISFGAVAFVGDSSGNSNGSNSVFVASAAAYDFSAVERGGPLERLPI